jgi:hypothetical protein
MARVFGLLTYALSLNFLFNLDRPFPLRFIRILLLQSEQLTQLSAAVATGLLVYSPTRCRKRKM